MDLSSLYIRYALRADDPAVAGTLIELADDRAVARQVRDPKANAAFTADVILGLLSRGRVGHARLATSHAPASELPSIVAATVNGQWVLNAGGQRNCAVVAR